MSAFRGFVRKEFLHIARDRRTLLILLLMPLIQVLLFGYAIRTEIRNIDLVVVDPQPDAVTLALRSRLEGSGIFRIVAVTPRGEDVHRFFQRGDARAAVLFQPGFGSELRTPGGAQLLVITDAADPNSGATIRSYTTSVIADYQRELAGASGGTHIVPQFRMRFNPTLASANLFVPGLIAYVLIIITALMTAISLTREKETGTMEVLLVSPLRPTQIIIGKVVPYFALAFINVVTTLLVAWVIFGVPVRGNVVLLLAESMLYSLTALSIGVFISTRTDSQRVAMTAAMGGMMLPTLMLSGFIFPIESMPPALQVVSNVVPAKWFVLISRGIMLKGVGLAYLWQETLILTAMTVVLLVAAIRSFQIRVA